MSEKPRIYVIDTSSLVEIKERMNLVKKEQGRVFDSLTAMVTKDELVFPEQVIGELNRFTNSKNHNKADLPLEWARKNKQHATRFGQCYQELREVLAHPFISKVVDQNNTSGVEEADPYVISLAKHLTSKYKVIVLTEDTIDRPNKNSIYSCCSLLDIVSIRVKPFLLERGILLATKS